MSIVSNKKMHSTTSEMGLVVKPIISSEIIIFYYYLHKGFNHKDYKPIRMCLQSDISLQYRRLHYHYYYRTIMKNIIIFTVFFFYLNLFVRKILNMLPELCWLKASSIDLVPIIDKNTCSWEFGTVDNDVCQLKGSFAYAT